MFGKLVLMIQQRKSCYCAFCKTQRKVYSSKHLNMFGIVGLVLLSYVLSYVIWDSPDSRGLITLGLMLFTAELFCQLRWRQSMICKNCGFDPVIYVRDPSLAGEKIKEFIHLRSESPQFLLKPALNLPVRRVSQKGENLSLHG